MQEKFLYEKGKLSNISIVNADHKDFIAVINVNVKIAKTINKKKHKTKFL